jgi:hypothetical protein
MQFGWLLQSTGAERMYRIHVALNDMNVLAEGAQVFLNFRRYQIPSTHNMLNLSSDKKCAKSLGKLRRPVRDVKVANRQQELT